MKYFKDPANNQVFAFEDNVTAVPMAGGGASFELLGTRHHADVVVHHPAVVVHHPAEVIHHDAVIAIDSVSMTGTITAEAYDEIITQAYDEIITPAYDEVTVPAHDEVITLLKLKVPSTLVAITEDEAAALAVPATPSVPYAVTMRQGRLALLSAGILADVDFALASMPGAEGDAARIEWEFAAEIKRDHPLVTALLPSLGLSEEQIDQLFIAATAL